MRSLACVISAILIVTVVQTVGAKDFGHFIGTVEAMWLDDGRQMQLTSSFKYVDPNNVEWHAPKGAIVDGASIPQWAWTYIGGPFTGKYRNASVIHDVACDAKKRPWDVVHLAFYNAMRASDVSAAMAKVMYAAVYYFGPRWPKEARLVRMSIIQESFDVLANEIQLRETIAGNEMSLDEIRNFFQMKK